MWIISIWTSSDQRYGGQVVKSGRGGGCQDQVCPQGRWGKFLYKNDGHKWTKKSTRLPTKQGKGKRQ